MWNLSANLGNLLINCLKGKSQKRKRKGSGYSWNYCTKMLSSPFLSLGVQRKIVAVDTTISMSLAVPCSWLLLCSDECSLLHGTKLMSVHGCSWVFNGNQEHSCLLLAAYECSWGLFGAYECSWSLQSMF